MISILPHPETRGAFRLTSELHLPAPRDEVFEFFGDATNLQALTPPWLNFEVLTPPPIDMHAGALIDYRIRLRFIPIRWRTEITQWEPPLRFEDRQLKGPYRFWHHQHIFEAIGDETLAKDQVDYAVLGGRLVHALVVRRDVQRIFEYRHEALRKRFS